MIVDYIDSQRERFGVEPVCAVLAEAGISIAPSTYYARSKTPLTDVELDEAYMANQLRSLWQNNWGVYGARKLWHAARRAGHDIGRDQVARLMKIAGISGVLRGRHRTITTGRDDAAPRHPDLVKRGWAAPTGIDQLWVADFSYVWTLAGFCYVAFVVDVFSRRILGWRVTTTKHTDMVTDALRQALQVRRRRRTRLGGRRFDPSFRRRVAIRLGRLHRRTARRRDRRLDRHRRRRAGQRLMRIDHRAVQDRSDQPHRTSLGRPPRRRMAGRPLGPLVQHRPASLLDRAPAPG